MGDARPGDNLYSTSVIALDADTGRMRGYHQYHWNDSWDWDEVSAPVLMDVQHDGRTIRRWCIRRATAISGCWSGGRRHRIRRRQAIRQAERVHEAWTRRPAARTYDETRNRCTARRCPSVRRFGAARIGRRRPTARRPAICTSPPTRICAARSWVGEALRGRQALAGYRDQGRPHGRTDARSTSASCRPGTWTPARKSGQRLSSPTTGDRC